MSYEFSVETLVKDAVAKLMRYQQHKLYYDIKRDLADGAYEVYQFPVHIADVSDAIFYPEMPATSLEPHVRYAMENGLLALVAFTGKRFKVPIHDKT